MEDNRETIMNDNTITGESSAQAPAGDTQTAEADCAVTSEAPKKDHRRRNTIILAVVVLAVAGGGLLWQRLANRRPDSGLVAVVQLGGEVIDRLDLDKDTQLIVGDKNKVNDYNVVTVKDGKVSVTESNCENQICVYTGEIQYEGEVIACLPHSLIIYIDTDKDKD